MLEFQEQKKMGGEKFHAPLITGGEQGLRFSETSIQFTVFPGETKEGSFTVTGPQTETVTGFVLSDNLSMQVETTSFSGTREIISWQFHAAAYAAGDEVTGSFRILSSHGEYRLPFKVTIVQRYLSSDLGEIRNLNHFTNLAKTNWKAAADLFYQPSFPALFAQETEEDQEAYALYRGLSGRNHNEQNVEEFLIATGKKQAMEFIPQVSKIDIDLPTPEHRLVVRHLNIKTNGWGYQVVRVSFEGAFLRAATEDPTLTEKDFREGAGDFVFAVDPSSLHAGKNLGAIILHTPFKDIRVPVAVRYCAEPALRFMHRKEQHELIVRMMKAYQAMRAHKLPTKDFVSQVGPMIGRLGETDRNNTIIALYKIHYLITAKRYEDAIWELGALNRVLSGIDGPMPTFSIAHFDLEDDVVYAYRMYLTEMCAENSGESAGVVADVTAGAIRGIENMHNGNPENWWITWLLMYASDEYRRRPSQAWMLLQDQFMRGCRSPILYCEAYQMVTMNPAILHNLSDFEESVLLYAARQNALTDTVMTQINYLVKRQRDFSNKLFRVLAAGYESDALAGRKEETLESIVTLLIRGNETDSKYFVWYQRAVDAGLAITRLFEYYMLSLPAGFDGELSQMVIMYFAYQSTLPFERNAYLYHYLLAHKEEYDQVLYQYQAQIDSFTLDSFMQHRMSDDLAYLYQKYLSGSRVLTNELASSVVPTIFGCRLRTTNPRMHRAVLTYRGVKAEQYFPIENGEAHFPVYGACENTNETRIFLEDDDGNRYVVSAPFVCEHMMNYKALTENLLAYDISNAGFDLYLANILKGTEPTTVENALFRRRLVDSEVCTERTRQEMRLELLLYYKENDLTRELDEILTRVLPDLMTSKERDVVIGYFAERGMVDSALSWIRRFGTFGIRPATLMRLCSGQIQENGSHDDRILRAMAQEAFRQGVYDDRLLNYLAQYCDALTEDLMKIRTAVVDFGLDDYIICRRMLIQMLYTGVQLPERAELIAVAAKGGCEPELMSQLLAQSAHYYYLYPTDPNARMEAAQFDRIAEYGKEGIPLLDICRIAWLLQESTKSGAKTPQENEITALFLGDLMDEGIVFPFFRQFIGILPELQAYADETLVEYRIRPGKVRTAAQDAQVPAETEQGETGELLERHIAYHYAMEKNGQREPYQARQMKAMYEGVYVTGFLLFFGEQMHYFITDDLEEKHIVETGTQSQDARIPEESDDRFGRINKISMLTALGRDEEAMNAIADYDKTAYLAAALFRSGEV